MQAIDLLLSRNSLGPAFHDEPGPDEHAMATILAAAVRAPDHARLRPWRFLVIAGAARARLGEVFVAALRQRDPTADEAAIEKERGRPLRSPMLIAVIARLTPDHPKTPIIEQVLSAGAAAMQILNAAQALGFGAMWLTGANAYDGHVLASLGVADGEQLIGFVYLGTPRQVPRDVGRPDWRAHVAPWTGPIQRPGPERGPGRPPEPDQGNE